MTNINDDLAEQPNYQAIIEALAKDNAELRIAMIFQLQGFLTQIRFAKPEEAKEIIKLWMIKLEALIPILEGNEPIGYKLTDW